MAEVKMPKLGESVTEGTLGKWLKQVGEQVYKYEPLVEVVTDKVSAEIPSDFEGVLTAILVQENETVKVGVPIAVIEEAGSGSAQASSASPESIKSSTQIVSNGIASAPQESAMKAETGAEAVAFSQSAAPTQVRYSPAVLKLAQERGIDLSKVKGTGIAGRVTRKDVLGYTQSASMHANPSSSMQTAPTVASAMATQNTPESATVSASATQNTETTSIQAPDNEEWIPVSAVRKTIASRMVQSKHQAPHAWMMVEVDVTPLVRLRERHKAEFKQREGIDLTYLPFFIRSTVEALKEFPIMNSTWADDKIILKKDIHISIAVATDNALVVPVIRHADRLSILGIAGAVADLARRARSGKLTIQDVQDGTFTVNNTGAFGSILSQPIINAPQAAILSVESIVRRPIVRDDDSIAIRSMVNLCLSLDHRILDGWVAGQFLRSIKQRLEGLNESTSLY